MSWEIGDLALTSGGIPVVVIGMGQTWAGTARLDSGRSIPHHIAKLRPIEGSPEVGRRARGRLGVALQIKLSMAMDAHDFERAGELRAIQKAHGFIETHPFPSVA